MTKIIGIDASTSTIGISAIDFNDSHEPKLVNLQYFKPYTDDNLIINLDNARNFVIETIKKFEPNHVIIEDIIYFMKGRSTAKTITGLTALNRTVALASYHALGKVPLLLSVLSIRNYIKAKFPDKYVGRKLPEKEEIPDLVANLLKIPFPYIYDKKNKIMKENYDMGDAVAAGLAGYAKLFEIKSKNKKLKK